MNLQVIGRTSSDSTVVDNSTGEVYRVGIDGGVPWVEYDEEHLSDELRGGLEDLVT